MAIKLPSLEESLPKHKDLFYGGKWQLPKSGIFQDTYNPGNGMVIGKIGQAGEEDVEEAILAADAAFDTADIMRKHAAQLALLDAYNTGNPVVKMLSDANVADANMDYFAGLIPMTKGETIPQAEDHFHYTLREPLGMVSSIIAFNHPVMFAGAKMAAPLAADNTVIIKPPDQPPLSCLRLAEILGDVFRPGVVNVMLGGRESLIGSVPTGKAIARTAADALKPTLLEFGRKNALIAFPDADIDKLAVGVAKGIDFTWTGQSCGSASRVFLHDLIHDEVAVLRAFRLLSTTMGLVISKTAQDRVLWYILWYIKDARHEGAKLVCGGKVPEGINSITGVCFIEPTIFSEVRPEMRIARDEIYGPVMSVFRWTDEAQMLRDVNNTAYGLTASIFTKDMATAQKAVKQIQAGYVWVKQVGRHFLRVPFGGYKESGGGQEESLDELLSFTQIKSVNVSFAS
ncbi:MAG: hypothetical protein FE78DRAFT_103625 [Acidomyces sp. 'richmondensis']|nr:MAG: hypothetical protein FE78DRAFT_103625 [Acidomyces sp. 'richmondensis']